MLEDLIRQHINQANIVQLATAQDNQPWVCTLHFYADNDLNIYWISTEARQHSKEIAANPKVATTILVHENTPSEDYVIGLSVVGQAELVGQEVDSSISEGYISKLNKPKEIISDIASGTNPHRFYKLVPSKFVLFDSKNFPDNPRQELTLGPKLGS